MVLTRVSHGEDVEFFEKLYNTKIKGVKTIEEYSDSDQYYSAIAKQIGIHEIAFKAASKNTDGRRRETSSKPSSRASGGADAWGAMVFRIPIDKETGKPIRDKSKLEMKFVVIKCDGQVQFPKDPDPRSEKPGQKAELPNELPGSAGKSTDLSKPVKVFILLGQSNMLGFGRVGPVAKQVTLEYMIKDKGKYQHLVYQKGQWTERKDVRYVHVMDKHGVGMRP